MTPVQLPEAPALTGKTLDQLIAECEAIEPGITEKIEKRYQELRAEYAAESQSETNSER